MGLGGGITGLQSALVYSFAGAAWSFPIPWKTGENFSTISSGFVLIWLKETLDSVDGCLPYI